MSALPVQNVRDDHGAVGDGITDDTAKIQAAINAGGTVVWPNGDYVSGPLNVTNVYNQRWIADPRARLRPVINHPAWAQPHGHLIDLSGSVNVDLGELSIGAPGLPGSIPASAIFLGQTPNNAANAIILNKLTVTGQYRASPLYVFGVPSCQIYSSKFYNHFAGPGTHPAGLFTNTNIGGLTSQFTTLASGPVVTRNWHIVGTEWHMLPGAGANGSVVFLDDARSFQFVGGNMSGGAVTYIATNGTVMHILAHGVTFETEGQPVLPTYLFYSYSGALSDVSLVANEYAPGGLINFGGPGSHP